MKFGKIIDITRKIHPGTAVWTNDKGVSISRDLLIKEGAACNLSSISLGLHTGTHIDAPSHFIDGADTLDTIDLSRFIGIAKVFELNVDKCISLHDINSLPINENDVVLFKTSNSLLSEDDAFSKTFVYIDISAAGYLADKKIKTVGIDYLSVEQYASSNHETHLALLSKNIGVIEGLNLRDVKEGEYFFSCLPLRISEVEGSPARAVLVEFED